MREGAYKEGLLVTDFFLKKFFECLCFSKEACTLVDRAKIARSTLILEVKILTALRKMDFR